MKKEDQAEYFKELWDLIINDRSWAFPQLLAILSLIDPDFSNKVKMIEVTNASSKNEDLRNEIEALLNGEPKEIYVHGVFWKRNLEKLINQGKL